jgi:hypothetical protein
MDCELSGRLGGDGIETTSSGAGLPFNIEELLARVIILPIGRVDSVGGDGVTVAGAIGGELPLGGAGSGS